MVQQTARRNLNEVPASQSQTSFVAVQKCWTLLVCPCGRCLPSCGYPRWRRLHLVLDRSPRRVPEDHWQVEAYMLAPSQHTDAIAVEDAGPSELPDGMGRRHIGNRHRASGLESQTVGHAGCAVHRVGAYRSSHHTAIGYGEDHETLRVQDRISAEATSYTEGYAPI